jgi:hypothetical protein
MGMAASVSSDDFPCVTFPLRSWLWEESPNVDDSSTLFDLGDGEVPGVLDPFAGLVFFWWVSCY